MFPDSQFILPDFKKPYRLNVMDRSGDLITFVRIDIPSGLVANAIWVSPWHSVYSYRIEFEKNGNGHFSMYTQLPC